MSTVIEASGLGKAYRRTWALRLATGQPLLALAVDQDRDLLGLALGLAGSCFWRLNRRRS